MRHLLLASILSFVAAGCGGGSGDPDGGGGVMDGATGTDAGGGGTDAGGGGIDAAPGSDGGPGPDAGDVDAGPGDDAGAGLDAGPGFDAGPDFDAGMIDASVPPTDAGGACDAMDVMEGTPCGPTERPAPRYVWNGRSCDFAPWCRCVGTDCAEIYRTEADCLAAYAGCLPSCRTDADCTSGAEWCESGTCVACDNSGLLCDIACFPAGWAPYERNGCFPCECGPPSECQADTDCRRGERCYPGAFCWCPAGAPPSPDCCIGNVCSMPGCPEPPPTGCRERGCPMGDTCDLSGGTCTPSSCNCGPSGSWACTRDCGGGTCVSP